MRPHHYLVRLAILGLALAGGCGDDDGGPPPADAPPASLLDTTTAAVAGGGGLDRVRTQQVKATGRRFDHLEGYAPTSERGYEQLVYADDIAIELTTGAHHGTWTSTTVEVFPGTMRHWVEVSDGRLGYVTGDDGGFPPAGDGAPMPSSRVTARRKELTLMTPALLLQHAAAHRDQVHQVADEVWQGGRYHVLTIAGLDGWPAPARLFVDPVTSLPAKVDTREDDPVYGDALVEFAFHDWRPAGVSLAPFGVTETLAGQVILDETRREVVDNPTLPTDEFQIPAGMGGSVDATSAAWGARSSEYLLRTQEYGFAGYVDVAMYAQPVPLATGVVHYQVGGYNSLAVELPSSILVVEAPLYESVSARVIADIHQRFPGKPIKHLVSTHFHYDHSGGIRAYAAEGAQLIVPIETADYYRAMLAAPHTLVPDALARAPRDVQVTAVGDRLTIREGGRAVTVYDIAQSHSAGALVAYVDDARMLFTSDLYNPGGLGPNPMQPERPYHDLYARELLRDLAALGFDEANLTTFVGGHGGSGTWAELRIFGGAAP